MAAPRITDRHLQRRLDQINEALGYPKEPYQQGRRADGSAIINPYNLHLEHAYGATGVCQMLPTGGETTVIPLDTKRTVHVALSAMLWAVREAKEGPQFK